MSISMPWSNSEYETTMPASRKASRGEPSAVVVTSTFPGCRSPWTKLCTKSISQKASMPVLQSCCRSSAVSASPAAHSTIGTPSTQDSTRTALATYSPSGSGKSTGGGPPPARAKLARKRRKLSASRRKSSWRRRISVNSSLIPPGLSHRTRGRRCSPPHTSRSRAPSAWMYRPTCGCSTLTATGPHSPSRRSSPRCTCAMQPEPTGCGVMRRTERQPGPKAASSAASVASSE
mmetsp:Transcript_14077/g.45237  ORF Transcript_14077/g.45237 Transcript_14077/m.45237 type:complete len:233 (-) Transcript_14077:557-1255(-)